MADSIIPPLPMLPATLPVELQPQDNSKKAQLAEMSEAKKLLLGGSQTADVAGSALRGENNLARRNQVLLDAASLDPLEFASKYGNTPENALAQANLTGARDRAGAVDVQQRTDAQILSDAANSVAQGAINSAGGIVALGAGLVNDQAGNAVAGVLGDITEGMQGAQSSELNRARVADAIAGNLDRVDSREQYERDVTEGNDAVAALKRIGRDFGRAVERSIENPTVLGDTVAQGVGSLAVAGPVGKGIKVAGSGLQKVLGEVGEKVLERAATPTAIGLMEGGGAYSQASQEVMNMSHEQLAQDSQVYRDAIATGSTPEEAKQAAANRAGLIAGAIQAPIGAATGTLVSRFESAPLRVPSLRTGAGNIVREAVEETIQSGSGELAVGTGVREAADPDRDVLQDVGTSAAIGGLAGAGTAGVVQTPGAILRGAADAVKATIGSVIKRGEKVDAANSAASPAAAKVIDTEVEKAVNQIPAIATGLFNAAKVETQEQQTELNDFVGRVARTAQIAPEEMESLPETVRGLLPETDNRYETLMAVAAAAINPSNTPTDRISAGLFVRQQLRENESVFTADLPSALSGLSEDSEEFQQFSHYKTILDSINQHPQVQKVLEILKNTETLPDEEEITPQTVTNTAGMAVVNPIAVNPKTADLIMHQADNGTIDLDPEVRRSIQAASSLVRATQQYAQDLADMGQPLAQDISKLSMQDVSKQILKKSDDPNKMSLSEHLAGITQAIQSGDNKLARTRAIRLAQFARHMRNKMEAVNKSFAANGQKQPFQAVDGAGKLFTTEGPSIHKGSSKLAQQIFAEATYVANLNNNIAEIFPELGISKITVDPLVPALRKPVTQAEQQVKSTRQIPENRTQEADRRVVETPVQDDTLNEEDAIPEAPVVETEAVVEQEVTAQEDEVSEAEVVSEPTPVVSEVREEAEPEATEEVQESVQGNEQETTEGLPTESGPETSDAATVTVDTAYPDLIAIGGNKNRFKQAFKFPKELTSRLIGQESPLNYLYDLLRNATTLGEVAGELRYSYDKPIARAYREYLTISQGVVLEMNDRLRKVLTKEKTRKSGEKYTMLSDMQKEDTTFDITTTPRGRAFSILNQDGNYNPELLQQAVAAGLHWALNADRTTYPKDAEDLAKSFGIDESEVTDDMVTHFNIGLDLSDAVQSLGSMIQQFWGVQSDKNAPEGYVKGIPEAVAKEVLYGLQDTGLIKLDPGAGLFDDIDEMKGKKFPRVWFGERPEGVEPRAEEIENLVEILDRAPEVIADAVLTEPEAVLHIGQAPPTVAETQMRNPLVKNTKQQKEVIRKAQSTPFYPNMMMLDLLRSLGEETVINLFGGDASVKDKLYNKNHRKSVEGKNLGLQNSYRNLKRQLARLQNYATAQGTTVTETPTYYEFNVSRVGRLHMQGPSNPQSDKMARESFMSTRTTLDMTKTEDVAKFWMTVAQALGVKTEKDTRSVAVKKAQDKILSYESFMPAVRAFVQDGTALSQETLNDIKKKLGKDFNFKAMHALLAVAKLDSTENLTNFEHFLSLEADGKTDGPINALVHFTAGVFDENWIRNVARGGLYFGVRDKTLNAHYAEPGNEADLYEEAKGKLVTKQAEFRNFLDLTSPEAAELSNALLSVMDALSADVKFDGSKLELSRGVTKNPLTITIYGSGIDGIAGKVANGLIDTLYEKISDILQNGGEIPSALEANLELLLNNTVGYSKKNNKFFVKHNTNFKISGDPVEFTIPSQQMEQFKNNVKVLFVNQMNSAITEMMGPSMDTTRRVQKAIQVQSIALKHIFQAEVKARLAETGRKNNEFLSQKEMAQIYKNLEQYSPLIQTGTQTLLVGGKERKDIVDTQFSTSITEDLSTPAYVFAPENAGVGGAPYMVISTGDGQMVQNILARKDSPEGALMVFDGVEMKASTIDEDSLKINEAVFDGWMGNPVQNVSDSFKAFLRENPFDVLPGGSPEKVAMYAEIREALFGKQFGPGSTWEEALFEINQINENLSLDADSIQARHETMEYVELSVDHMASAEAAYTNDGQALPSDPVAMLAKLNEIYGRSLARIRKEKAQTPVGTTDETVASLGSTDSDSGAKVLTVKDLEGKFENTAMMQAVLNNPVVNDYKIVIGDPSQIRAYESNHDPENFDPTKNYLGKININQKTIYIANPSIETLAHELIHAATFDKVHAYYNNLDQLSDQDEDAIERLEGLMQEWLVQSYQNESPVAQEARRLAYSEIADHLNNGRDAEALNEFMAWSLANQAIADVQKKTKVKNPVYRILGEALKLLKKLIGLDIDDTLFSNIRFNTGVLLSTPTNYRANAHSIMYHQSKDFGSDQRLTDLREKFFNKIIAPINEQNDPTLSGNEAREALAQAQNVAGEFMVRGFAMNMQQASTFQMIHAAFATETELNPASLARIQDIYQDVMKKLTVESFMKNPEADDPNDRFNAQEKFNVLNGVYLTKQDKQGRSNLLPSFLALAMVDDSFRTILSEIETAKSDRNEAGTVDALLDNVGNSSLDRLSMYMSGEGVRKKDAKSALDALTNALVEQTGDQRTFIEHLSERTIGGFDQWVADKVQELSGKAAAKASDVMNTTNSKAVKAAAQVGYVLTSIVNNETAEHVANGVTSAMNQMNIWTPLRELTTEIIGRTKENANVFDMISKVRSVVQQTRQQFREHLPEKIAGHFTKALKDEDWTALFKGLGKTDLAVLNETHDLDAIRGLLVDDTALAVATSDIESKLQVSEGASFQVIKRKANELAVFMNTGKASGNLLRNAYAIANLFGAGGRKTAASEQTIKDVDHLVTLYALEGLDKDTKLRLKSLAETEQDGLNFALSYLVGQRSDEQAKLLTGAARANHYKGYIPSENQVGTAMVVADDSEYARLVTLGYTRVGDYKGSQAEGRGTKRGYYYAPVSGRAVFNQGVLQTVRTTASGVDPQTGLTVQDLTAGNITDPDEVARIIRNMGRNANAVEPLLPVYDESGDVIAFERSIDPAQMARMNRNTHLGQMIGAWRGRQVEEALARDFNKQLVNNLKQIWDEQKKDRSNEFIDLSNLTRRDDAVLHDAWSLVPREVRDHIQEVFGGEGFRIRRDMINDAVGFRSASVGDAWTGTTRWKPAVQEGFRKAAMGVFGNNAYKYMVHAEKFTQNLVGDAKVLIVVKSVVVPVANILSNMYQLAGRGVPVRNILQGMASKTTEVNQYIKNRDRQITLEADLRAAGNDLVKKRKIETELQSIKDSNKRMSIAALIEHGEFSSISDGGVTQEDLALSEGRFVDMMEKAVSKLPSGLRTTGRYAFITKDTALFKGLARAVQYGDFLAKAVMYEDLIKRKGLSKEEALGQVSEEFINYNRLAGRTRNYLESIGLLWFWNFKLRSMKVAASMVRNNPVRALMSAVMTPSLPVIGSIGSPVTDNFLSIMADGKLGYSIGPGMGLNSYNLNPWMNLFK
ncbi:virion RNA polymerase protein [Rhizobium phage RHph_X2_28B]|uniref:virion RNA polymerase protein n=1 Tax=Rhizobium phage RHph_X2_28B TaxID=2836086 RepID=UPI0023299C2F|nr:virion RNA polymerase protein [Rhizobium phage RHph_X2_28B]QWY83520.1 virion RNA polymerase protein [Rhizobium phage RHph_X2_28B]